MSFILYWDSNVEEDVSEPRDDQRSEVCNKTQDLLLRLWSAFSVMLCNQNGARVYNTYSTENHNGKSVTYPFKEDPKGEH